MPASRRSPRRWRWRPRSATGSRSAAPTARRSWPGIAAAHLGLDLRGCGRASVAALLADAGPISIEESERTSLTADRVGLADHALAVEDVVRRVAGLQDVAAVLRHQHERYDGSGVPDALAGSDIAIEARIVAAAVILAGDRRPGRARTAGGRGARPVGGRGAARRRRPMTL